MLSVICYTDLGETFDKAFLRGYKKDTAEFMN